MRDDGGSIIFQHTLRGGDLLSVVARLLPMSDQDKGFINQVRSNLAVNTDAPVRLSEHSGVEAIWLTRSATTGNVIAVIPTGPEVFTSGIANAVGGGEAGRINADVAIRSDCALAPIRPGRRHDYPFTIA